MEPRIPALEMGRCSQRVGRKSEKTVTKAKEYISKSEVSNTERATIKRKVDLAMMQLAVK